MKNNEIRGMLIMQGTNANRIATRIGVSKQAVYQVINGSRRTPSIRKAIAMAIGKPVEELWPDATAESANSLTSVISPPFDGT